MKKNIGMTFAITADGTISPTTTRKAPAAAGIGGIVVAVEAIAVLSMPTPAARAGLQQVLAMVANSLPILIGGQAVNASMGIMPGMVVNVIRPGQGEGFLAVYLGDINDVVCLNIFDKDGHLISEQVPRSAYRLIEVHGHSGAGDLAFALMKEEEDAERLDPNLWIEERLRLVSQQQLQELKVLTGGWKTLDHGESLLEIRAFIDKLLAAKS